MICTYIHATYMVCRYIHATHMVFTYIHATYIRMVDCSLVHFKEVSYKRESLRCALDITRSKYVKTQFKMILKQK